MKCYSCGYEGKRIEFKYIGTPDEGFLTRQCPKCGEAITSTTIDEREEDEKRIKWLCNQIREFIEVGNLKKAAELRKEAVELNEDIELEEEGEFLSQVRKELKRRGIIR